MLESAREDAVLPWLIITTLVGCPAPTPDDSSDTDPGVDETDRDGDGTPNAEDCAPNDPSVHPNASETCNGIDDDCSGEVDDGLLQMWYPDFDEDGYGGLPGVETCTNPAGYVLNGDDCLDTDADVNPDAEEVCDEVDNDCDGTVDEDPPEPPDPVVLEGNVLVTGDPQVGWPYACLVERLGYGVTRIDAYPDGLASDLSDVDSILWLQGLDYSKSLPDTTQQALVDWVNGGGHLVAPEWVLWNVGRGYFTTVAPILPVTYVGWAEEDVTLTVEDASHPLTAGVYSPSLAKNASVTEGVAVEGAVVPMTFTSASVVDPAPAVALHDVGSGRVTWIGITSHTAKFELMESLELTTVLARAVGPEAGLSPWSSSLGLIDLSTDCLDDPDIDFVATPVDNCPAKYNPSQLDTDGDGIGDDCDDLPTCP